MLQTHPTSLPCVRRSLPVLDQRNVSVTFRQMAPDENVVRYVMWSLSQLPKPLRCSVNTVIEKRDGHYHAEIRAPRCERTKLSAKGSNAIAALRHVLQRVELSGSCPHESHSVQDIVHQQAT